MTTEFEATRRAADIARDEMAEFRNRQEKLEGSHASMKTQLDHHIRKLDAIANFVGFPVDDFSRGDSGPDVSCLPRDRSPHA